jgi:hypothetical protein
MVQSLFGSIVSGCCGCHGHYVTALTTPHPNDPDELIWPPLDFRTSWSKACARAGVSGLAFMT